MKRTIIGVAAVLAAVLATAALAAGPLNGGYTAKIAGGPPPLNGSWRLAIKGNAFVLSHDGAKAVVGVVVVKKNRIGFQDMSGPLACRGSQATGVYTWRLAARTLRLQPVTDACVGRRLVLMHAFRKI